LDVSLAIEAVLDGSVRRLGSNHGFDDALATDCLFQEMYGFGNAIAVRSQSTTPDCTPYVF
jgi:hypothetical protein